MLHEPQAQKPRARWRSLGARGVPVCTWLFAGANRATFESLERGLIRGDNSRASACCRPHTVCWQSRTFSSLARWRALKQFLVPNMASTPPADRHLILMAKVKSTARLFRRRQIELVLPLLSWTGDGNKTVLYGDDRYMKADGQNGHLGWRILEELLVLVNDARAHHLRPPKEAIGISWLRVNVLQLLRELATPEDPAAFATLDARISLALAADKENPPVPSAQSPARLPGQAQKRSRRGCS